MFVIKRNYFVALLTYMTEGADKKNERKKSLKTNKDDQKRVTQSHTKNVNGEPEPSGRRNNGNSFEMDDSSSNDILWFLFLKFKLFLAHHLQFNE